MSMKNFNYTIRNRTRDFGACSAVPQPSTPQRASPNISRYAKLRSCEVHVAYMGRLETETYCLSGILRKRDPSGHSYNWSIVKMYLKETGWEGVKLIHPVMHRDGSSEQSELRTAQQSGNLG